MNELFPPRAVLNLIEVLEGAGFETWCVGGCVRDSFLGRCPADWDLSTAALPGQMRAAGPGIRWLDTGEKHGTLTALICGVPVEVTTFRTDGPYLDGRRPDGVRFISALSEDLKRRDFTVNAMAWNPVRGTADPFGGRRDLEKGVLRCVGEPERRFAEDGLRILRGVRFLSVYGFRPEEETARAMHRGRSCLSRVSAERKRVELMKLLAGEYAEQPLREYADVIEICIPGFSADTAGTACRIPAARPELRLAEILAEAEKQNAFTREVLASKSETKDNTERSRMILNSLRFDRKTRERILRLIALRGLEIPDDERSVLRAMSETGPEVFLDLLILKKAETAGRRETVIFERTEKTAHRILADDPCLDIASLAVSGRDLILAGVPEGPRVGQLLRKLLDWVIDGDLRNEREELLRALEKKHSDN